ncbi:hypothetical protein Dalk_4093 [Desulfatibacillum aliphaticivorans]|uniref:Uncharacterized protein n=1 Tax=Desulfatibacillum aliphaticivorans TaxID=218208 RepID=B8FM45_DESAL|nr:hypothetical protein Dalk_4093 [Desulfatibacillum aliphaticivorans]
MYSEECMEAMGIFHSVFSVPSVVKNKRGRWLK